MGRTFWVWVIVILTMISVILEGSAVFYLYSGAFVLPPQIVAYAAETPTDVVLISLFVELYYLAPAIALFMMRRIALPLFVISIPIELLQYGWEISLLGWEETMSGAGLVTATISIALIMVVCFYVWTLDRRGAQA